MPTRRFLSRMICQTCKIVAMVLVGETVLEAWNTILPRTGF